MNKLIEYLRFRGYERKIFDDAQSAEFSTYVGLEGCCEMCYQEVVESDIVVAGSRSKKTFSVNAEDLVEWLCAQ